MMHHIVKIAEDLNIKIIFEGEFFMMTELVIIANYYGLEKQRIKAIEELAELTKELAKKVNNKKADNDEAIAEEIADVEIMLAQLKFLMGIQDSVCDIKNHKIDRTMRQIESKKQMESIANELNGISTEEKVMLSAMTTETFMFYVFDKNISESVMNDLMKAANNLYENAIAKNLFGDFVFSNDFYSFLDYYYSDKLTKKSTITEEECVKITKKLNEML